MKPATKREVWLIVDDAKKPRFDKWTQLAKAYATKRTAWLHGDGSRPVRYVPAPTKRKRRSK